MLQQILSSLLFLSFPWRVVLVYSFLLHLNFPCQDQLIDRLKTLALQPIVVHSCSNHDSLIANLTLFLYPLSEVMLHHYLIAIMLDLIWASYEIIAVTFCCVIIL